MGQETDTCAIVATFEQSLISLNLVPGGFQARIIMAVHGRQQSHITQHSFSLETCPLPLGIRGREWPEENPLGIFIKQLVGVALN